MMHPEFGQSWKWYQQFGKPIAITEFCNSDPGVSKADKAREYVNYYANLRRAPGLLGAYSFIVSTSSGWQDQQWNSEMARIVGARE